MESVGKFLFLINEIKERYQNRLAVFFLKNLVKLSRKEVIDKALESSIHELKELNKEALTETIKTSMINELPEPEKSMISEAFGGFMDSCRDEVIKDFKNDIYEMYSKI